MWRAIGGVVVGYIVMAAFVMITFTVMYRVLGAGGAFAEGSYEPSMVWSVASLVLGFVAALIGGFVCALIARGGRAPKVFAGLVLVLGIWLAVAQMQELNANAPAPREGDITMADAMTKGTPPVWVMFGNPIVGVIGVLIGAGLRGTPKER